ncbi:NADPH-dependent F420 reductase [Erwinia aeris]|jgi:predicted dinucleotide-binding enzyme|uniref:NADPH-dependent F420 reductase n=1 Tax=Erwinia aeris TaxID=3239803 RepID=UPI003F79E386
MNIGIIGAGNIGATLAAKLSACGHSVRLANSRGPETIAEVARKAGATAVTREEAVKGADAVILSTPFTAHQGLAELLKIVPASVPVIDTSNYYPFRDDAIPALAQGKPESVWASEQAGRPLIKAWNAVLAATLADKGMPVGVTERIAIPVAGDDETAKRIAMALVSDTGFDAVDAGSLAESWRQQPGTPAYCTELSAAALKKALLAADKERAPVNREALLKEFMSASEPLTHEHIVARNRAVTA